METTLAHAPLITIAERREGGLLHTDSFMRNLHMLCLLSFISCNFKGTGKYTPSMSPERFQEIVVYSASDTIVIR